MNRFIPWVRFLATAILLLGMVACEAGDTASVGDGQELECSLGETSFNDAECTSCECTAAGVWECIDVSECVPGVGRTECSPGTQRDKRDGCNTCDCSDEGVWICTEKACDDPGRPVLCAMADKEYAVGDTANDIGDNWCNLCTCQADGAWACDEAVCDNECKPGETKEEDCNTCKCTEGHLWECTDEECVTPDCEAGETKIDDDGCSVCECLDGAWDCDASGCPESCEGGQAWNECGSSCTATCDEPEPMCTMECVAKCECPADAPIWHDGQCIALDACPAKPTDCDGGQVWNDCASTCTKTCDDPLPACSKECAQACECPVEAPLWENGQCITADDCPADPTECDPGKTKTEDDGCTVCTCLADGTWECDATACGTPTDCIAGESKTDGDGCTVCTCLADGTWECDATACGTPTDCDAGASKTEDDGCTVCTCLADGTWECDATACGTPTDCIAGESKTDGDGCTVCTCLADGTWECDATACGTPTDCDAGASKTEDDGCTVCTCLADGTWECDATACGTPTDCEPGAAKTDEDGCSVCTCLDDGTWECDSAACPESCTGGMEWNPCGSGDKSCVATCDNPTPECLQGADVCLAKCECPLDMPIFHEGSCIPHKECPGVTPATCTMGDTEYESGASAPGEGDNWCNTCTCDNGAWACTEMDCANDCSPGEKMDMDDGCNTCECTVDHVWSCTDDVCPPAACTEDECGAKPGMPNTLCDDGVTMAGPAACEHQADGACGWTIVECPKDEDKCKDVVCTSTEPYCDGLMAHSGTYSECDPESGECISSPGAPPEQCEFACKDGQCVGVEECTGGQVWSDAAPMCPALTCQDSQSECLNLGLEAKCTCPPEKPILHDGLCIPLDDCPDTPPVCVVGDVMEVDCGFCECQDLGDGETWWACNDLCPVTCDDHSDCAAGEFCMVPLGACGDLAGECTPKPDACVANVDVVCGCDGKAYNNGCEAHADGVNIAKDGPCGDGPGDPCPGGEGVPVECFNNPCDGAVCSAHPDATCVPADCSCDAIFYDADGAPVDCGTCADANGQEYDAGESFPGAGGNWCNTCTCKDNGQIACTSMGCPSFCDSDADCADTHWCRFLDPDTCPDNEPDCMSCTPYMQEGESCGGNTLSWFAEQCDPSLTCVDLDPLIADEPGECQADDGGGCGKFGDGCETSDECCNGVCVEGLCSPEIEECEGDDKDCVFVGCVDGDIVYEVGQSFPDSGDNWCNTCTCQASGQITCTLMGCPSFCDSDADCADTHWCRGLDPEACPDDEPDCMSCTPYMQEGESCGGFVIPWFLEKCEPSLACVDLNPLIADEQGECQVPIPQSCEPGTLGVAEDGCNDCLCMEDGTWYCNDTACTSECFAGEQKMAADGCNTCNCSVNADGVGIWNCTKKGCFGCLPGETMTAPDGCNTCMCIPEDGFNDDEPIDDGPDDDFGEFDEKGEPEEEEIPMSPCWNCLMTGGTWQPEAEACTTNCDIQDISCYVDDCPDEEPMDDQWICTELLECVDVVPAGCTSDFDCADGFCKTPDGQCGGGGECKPFAQVCPDDWTPVCGCDDNTYSNVCDAEITGVSVAYPGPCDDAGGEPDACPAAVPFDGMCMQMIAWAFNPESATCCSYPNPCVVPADLEGPYGSEEECLAGGPDGGDGGGFGGGGGGFGDGGGGDFEDDFEDEDGFEDK